MKCSLHEQVALEAKAALELQALGLNASESTHLLMSSKPTTNEQGNEAIGDVFDVRDSEEGGGIIMWMNNLERDSRYKRWPKDLTTLYQPNYFGQLKRVRQKHMSRPICYRLFYCFRS